MLPKTIAVRRSGKFNPCQKPRAGFDSPLFEGYGGRGDIPGTTTVSGVLLDVSIDFFSWELSEESVDLVSIA